MPDSSSVITHLPLTQSQQLIYTGQQLQPSEPLYNMVITFRIRGEVSPARFARAFQQLIDSADAMRCTFKAGPQGCQQLLQNRLDYALPYIDFSQEDEPQARLQEWLSEHSQCHFVLETRLFESALIKLAEQDYVWYLNQHHLITDAWAVGVQFARLQKFYSEQVSANAEAFSAWPDFQDYLAHEKQLKSSPAYSKAQAFWAANQPKFLPSHFYRQTPNQREGRTKRTQCQLGKRRSEKLRTLITLPAFRTFSEHLSLMQVFTTLLFCYLYRTTGNTQLAIGTPNHGRSTANLKQTVGMLINVFPLQIAVDEGDTFASLFAKVGKANQRLMVNGLPGVNESQHNRAFDVLLNYIPSSFGDFDGNSVQSEWVHSGYGDRNHLLRLQIHDFDQTNEFTLFFDLNESVFVGQEADWVSAHFLKLLDAMLDNAEQEICRPALIDASIATAACAKASAPADEFVSLTTLIQRQAGLTPEKVALRQAQSQLTYAQLHARTEVVAQAMASAGVGRGDVVAIALPRSTDAVLAILAVMRLGAVFLPIDVAQPEARTAYILADANAKFVFSESATDWSSSPDILRLCLTDMLTPQPLLSPLEEVTLDGQDPAYIIYTSGSTGKPKGVLLHHAGISTYCRWAKDFYRQNQVFDFVLFTSLGFDLTLTSMFVPLISGGTLVVYPEPELASDILIRQIIEDNQVDVLKLTPAHLALIQHMDFSTSRLKALIVGGDQFPRDMAQTISAYFGNDIAIYNEYGPTETTVACSVHKFDPKRDHQAAVPIGQAIKGAQILVLDEYHNPVPQGVVGELYIAGEGVATGYLNMPEVNARRFVYNKTLQQRMYRSGDLAKWNEHGQLEYLGRNDQQIKIRGVRIEREEVAASLLSLQGVHEAYIDTSTGLEQHQQAVKAYCVECGLDADHPSAQLDDEQVCRLCRHYQSEQQHAQAYFRTEQELAARITQIKQQATGSQDCIMLLSGGKDSSYALCRLVDMGLTPLVFTLDNGFISEGAMANVRRLVERLGLELVIGETPAMNEIFVDSLTRFSNVCNGCFKTIYTLSMNLAKARGINVICTGLSRGQVFETRVAHLFVQGRYDPADIDSSIIQARKAYHRTEDAVSRALDIKIFEQDDIFEQIQYLDFYRYTDVTLDEMLSYLKHKAPWIRPADTGRSTNCLINDAGIYVHTRERGYHNYGLPYSWDVRLGHKQRDAAMEELQDELDLDKVQGILDEVGYRLNHKANGAEKDARLIAYYVAEQPMAHERLTQLLSAQLPHEFIPAQFIWLEALPLNANGKVDRAALPRPSESRSASGPAYQAPQTENEAVLAFIWSQMLDVDSVGIDDNFFSLGGDSIVIIQIVAAARGKGLEITPQQMFDFPNIRELAEVVSSSTAVQAEQGTVSGDVGLLPIQALYLQRHGDVANGFCQSVLLESDDALQADVLTQALGHLYAHHDALRSQFHVGTQGWQARIASELNFSPEVNTHTLAASDDASLEKALAQIQAQQQATFDIGKGPLFSLDLLYDEPSERHYLLAMANHLVVDGVSWWILLGDLFSLYAQCLAKTTPRLVPKTTSVKTWAQDVNTNTERQISQFDQHTITEQIQTWPLDKANTGVDELQLANDQASVQHCQIQLPVDVTQKLVKDVPANFACAAPELLLAALSQVLQRWSAKSTLLIDVEEHGRDTNNKHLDLTRTVGWLTHVTTCEIPELNESEPGQAIRVCRQALMQQSTSPSDNSPAVVLFNYMGQWERVLAGNSGLRFCRPIALHQHAKGPRRHMLEINAVIFDGQLHLDWSYSQALHSHASIMSLAQRCEQRLHQLIEFCINTEQSGLTPADFPDAGIDAQELDDILAEFGE